MALDQRGVVAPLKPEYEKAPQAKATGPSHHALCISPVLTALVARLAPPAHRAKVVQPHTARSAVGQPQCEAEPSGRTGHRMQARPQQACRPQGEAPRVLLSDARFGQFISLEVA